MHGSGLQKTYGREAKDLSSGARQIAVFNKIYPFKISDRLCDVQANLSSGTIFFYVNDISRIQEIWSHAGLLSTFTSHMLSLKIQM